MTEREAPPPGGGRTPPQDISAEQATLGSMLYNHPIALEGLAALAADDFYREAHKQIFAAMKTVAAAGDNVDLITVTAALRQGGLLEEVGGPQYLMALMNEAPTPQLVLTYAEIVRDRSRVRKLITFAASVQERGMANPEDATALLAETVTGVLSLAQGGAQAKTASVTQGWEEDAVRLHAAINQPYGVTAARSGIPALDKATGGWGGMYLVVMMSQEKAGKTSFSVQNALTSAIQFAEQDEGMRVLVIPLEEGRQSWIRLACCWLAQVNSQLSLPGRCPPEQKEEISERIAEGHGLLRELPVTIADRVRSVDEAVAAIQVEQQRGPLGLIVVDYLQRLSEGAKERESLTQIARSLQTVSEDVGAPLLLSSQISWDERGNPLTYGSRGATQDASIVLSLVRDVNEKKQKKDTGIIQCHAARSIPEFGELPYFVDYEHGSRFHDVEREADSYEYTDNGRGQRW